MASKKIDLFNNREVVADYYPHKRIEIRIGGFKIVVNKPFGTKLYGSNEMTIDTPSIQFSTNTTVIMDIKELELINKSILKAVEILNSENDGLIINKDFSINNAKKFLSRDIPNEVTVIQSKDTPDKIKAIPYKNITSDKVYEDIKGHKWIYLGEGFLLCNGHQENRCNGPGCEYCKQIYIDYDRLSKCDWEQRENTIIVSTFEMLLIDSYASKKRLIKIVKNLNCSVDRLIVGNTEDYRFIKNIGKTYWR